MLVFSRKIGQQVVLPEQGITIDVVDVGKTRVRLGISAPANIPVHRREVWDRAHGTQSGPPAAATARRSALRLMNRRTPRRPRSRSPISTIFWPAGLPVARAVASATCRVERLDGRIVIRGSARSHHVRQLAQAAVDEVLNVCDPLSLGAVEYDIDVAHVYWRSAGHTHELAKLREAKQ